MLRRHIETLDDWKKVDERQQYELEAKDSREHRPGCQAEQNAEIQSFNLDVPICLAYDGLSVWFEQNLGHWS
jgi:hypothetical protein